MDDKHTPLSRRAFLKRAGADAVSTGAKLVPGMAAAREALQRKDAAGPDGAEDNPQPGAPDQEPAVTAPAKRAWLRTLAFFGKHRKG